MMQLPIIPGTRVMSAYEGDGRAFEWVFVALPECFTVDDDSGVFVGFAISPVIG